MERKNRPSPYENKKHSSFKRDKRKYRDNDFDEYSEHEKREYHKGKDSRNKKQTPKKKNKPPKQTTKKRECICGCQFGSNTQLKRHLSVSHHGALCNRCFQIIRSESELRKHITFPNHEHALYHGQLPTQPSKELAHLVKRQHLSHRDAIDLLVQILKNNNNQCESEHLASQFRKASDLAWNAVLPQVGPFRTFIRNFPTLFHLEYSEGTNHKIVKLLTDTPPDSIYTNLQEDIEDEATFSGSDDIDDFDLKRYGFKESFEEIVQSLVTDYYMKGQKIVEEAIEKYKDLDIVSFGVRGMELLAFEKQIESLDGFGRMIVKYINIRKLYISDVMRVYNKCTELGMTEFQNLLSLTFQLNHKRKNEEEVVPVEKKQKYMEETQVVPIPTYDIYTAIDVNTLNDFQSKLNKRNEHLQSIQDSIIQKDVKIVALQRDLEEEKDKKTLYTQRIRVLREQLKVLEDNLAQSQEFEKETMNNLDILIREQQESKPELNRLKEIQIRDELYLRELQIGFNTIQNKN